MIGPMTNASIPSKLGSTKNRIQAFRFQPRSPTMAIPSRDHLPVEPGMEELVEHQTRGSPRPSLITPGLDHEIEIVEEPIEAVLGQGFPHRIDQKVEHLHPFPADDHPGWIEDVDDPGQRDTECSPGVGEDLLRGEIPNARAIDSLMERHTDSEDRFDLASKRLL